MPRAAPANWRWRGRCSQLVRSGALPQPERTIRFLWPAEIEGTIALLNARPEFARRTLATIHLDMIGGNTEITKSILRVYGSPPSLPSFVSDVGFTFARWVNDQSFCFAEHRRGALPADRTRVATVARSRPRLAASTRAATMRCGARAASACRSIYIADWPDRYIHTQRDVAGNLDPTKLQARDLHRRGLGLLSGDAEQSARMISPAADEHAGTGGSGCSAALRRSGQAARRARMSSRDAAISAWSEVAFASYSALRTDRHDMKAVSEQPDARHPAHQRRPAPSTAASSTRGR